METVTAKKEKWEIFKENYFINKDGYQNDSLEIEGDPVERIELLSPYICHVKIKKGILKASCGFMDEFNELRKGELLTEENYWSEENLISAIKKCEHKLILGNALVLLELNGVLECVCYILELGEYKNRGRIKPVQLRKRRLPVCPDINLI